MEYTYSKSYRAISKTVLQEYLYGQLVTNGFGSYYIQPGSIENTINIIGSMPPEDYRIDENTLEWQCAKCDYFNNRYTKICKSCLRNKH